MQNNFIPTTRITKRLGKVIIQPDHFNFASILDTINQAASTVQNVSSSVNQAVSSVNNVKNTVSGTVSQIKNVAQQVAQQVSGAPQYVTPPAAYTPTYQPNDNTTIMLMMGGAMAILLVVVLLLRK